MIRRTLYALALLTPLVMVSATARPALADTKHGAASVAVDRLLLGSSHDWNGTLFASTPGPGGDCGPDSNGYWNTGGQCWWWAAVTWNALITYAEQHGGLNNNTTLASDLWQTYTNICNNGGSGKPWGSCPSAPGQHGRDPFTVNTKGNTYFDDIGWWTQTWLNAYQLVGRPDYLYLAEELWNYATDNGYKDTTYNGLSTGCNAGSGSSVGIVQYHLSDGSVGDPDTFANALYLRNSAWLYQVTSNPVYMEGDSKSGNGGAKNAAAWIRQRLIFVYNGTVGNTKALFMMADHFGYDNYDNSQFNVPCVPGGNQWQLHGQGEMVSAWAEMASACSKYGNCNGGTGASDYYNTLADELALSITNDYPGSTEANYLSPNNAQPYGSTNPPPQLKPTASKDSVTNYYILTEPCSSGGGWPYNCYLNDSGTADLSDSNADKAWLISKGVFEQGIYCLTHNKSDSQLTTFVTHNADSLANLPNFGFLWQDDAATSAPAVQTTPISATQASVLNGLDADPAAAYPYNPSSDMCVPTRTG